MIWKWVFGANSVLGPGKGEQFFEASDLAIFQAVADHLSPQIRRLGNGRDVFGLIHADLHQNNYFFQKREVGAIDFQDCAWGYYFLISP